MGSLRIFWNPSDSVSFTSMVYLFYMLSIPCLILFHLWLIHIYLKVASLNLLFNFFPFFPIPFLLLLKHLVCRNVWHVAFSSPHKCYFLFVTFWWSLCHQYVSFSYSCITNDPKTQCFKTTIMYYSLCNYKLLVCISQILAGLGLSSWVSLLTAARLTHTSTGQLGIKWSRLSLPVHPRIEWWLCFKLGLAATAWQGRL